MYRTKHRTSHFGTNTFWDKDKDRTQNSFVELTGDKGKWPKLGIWKLTTHMTKWIWANRSFIGKAYGQ